MKCKFIFIAFGLFLLVNCSLSDSDSEAVLFEEIIDLKYAKGLSLYKTNEGTVVTITNPQTQEILDYFLVTAQKNSEMRNIKVVTTPFNSVLAYSSTYISFMNAINEVDKISGVTYSQGISNKKIKERLASKQTLDVGSDQSPDKELIVSLEPDLAMIYPSNGNHDWFQSFSIPTVSNVEYLEVHPLAQAEWIKLYGVLFEKEELADSLFRNIETNYLAEVVSNSISSKPVVLCGELYDDVWTLPGGRSLTSQLITDVGGDYFYKNDTSSGSKKLDFEYILSQDSVIDYWLLLTYNQQPVTYDYLKENKPRYSYLSVFSPEKIGICNTAITTYFETGILEPHILLKEIKSLIQDSTNLADSKYFKRITRN